MTEIRNNWTFAEVAALFDAPLMDLLLQAQQLTREHFPANSLQLCRLYSIKTGGCPEDCGYCGQSGHFKTGLKRETSMDVEEVLATARRAKELGSTRFCMGAAWRSPPAKDMPKVVALIEAIKGIGMETCMTLGMLDADQAQQLKDAGLDYYNHNLDTSPEHYPNITSTRTYQDRLDTLTHVREAGINVCCGGILGLGETREDRVSFLRTLANMPTHPQSVPINRLAQVKGTPLENAEPIESFEFIRTIAVARILMPASHVRLSAGRDQMSDEMQLLCFMAGANSIFYANDTLFMTANPTADKDMDLMKRVGIRCYSTEDRRQKTEDREQVTEGQCC